MMRSTDITTQTTTTVVRVVIVAFTAR